MASESKYAVGDKVIVTSVNRGRGYEGTVTKVGRKLVTVAGRWNHEDVFRIDTGAKNDAYQHECVWTLAEHAAREARGDELNRIFDHGIRFDYGTERRFTTDDLRRLRELLDELKLEGN